MNGVLGGRVFSCSTLWEAPYKPQVLWRGSVLRLSYQLRAAQMETVAGSGEVATAPTTENGAKSSDSIAQYVVIRKDLVESLKWPLGSVLAQACHAAVAAVWLHKDHPHTHEYCSHLDSMTTVTLEVKGETQLMNLANELQANEIAHKVWIEQPENFPTCLATKPYPKSDVAKYFKKLKLCK